MVLQKKRDAHTSNLFEHLNILKLPDKISLENCILICKYFNQSLLKSFKNWFTLAATSHTHNTRWPNSGCLKTASHKMKIYGRHSVNISAIYRWNYLQKLHVMSTFCFINYQVNLAWLKNFILLIITNSLVLCIVHYCAFAFFVTKSFHYFSSISVCDLAVQGNSPCFGTAIRKFLSDF